MRAAPGSSRRWFEGGQFKDKSVEASLDAAGKSARATSNPHTLEIYLAYPQAMVYSAKSGGATMRLGIALGFSLLLLAQDKKDLPAANPFSSPADVEQGKHLFGGQCAPCHGPAGDGGRGANLAQPNLPRAADDGALFTVIRYGLPGTEMPNSHQM